MRLLQPQSQAITKETRLIENQRSVASIIPQVDKQNYNPKNTQRLHPQRNRSKTPEELSQSPLQLRREQNCRRNKYNKSKRTINQKHQDVKKQGKIAKNTTFTIVLGIRIFGPGQFGLFGFRVIWVGMFRNQTFFGPVWFR